MNIKTEIPSPNNTNQGALATNISNNAIGASGTTITTPSSSPRLNQTPIQRNPSTMPQRSPFAIQELLGLNESSNIDRKMGAGITGLSPTGFQNRVLPHLQNDSNFHHHMLAAGNLTSRMAYFNAQAAVAAAYNMNSMAAAAAAVQVGMAGNGGSAAGNTSAMLGLNHISRDHNSGGESFFRFRPPRRRHQPFPMTRYDSSTFLDTSTRNFGIYSTLGEWR
ncbi:UNVERIFIED_CONTAM: hypothetical protein PYX00_009114 [Menopon gallinae]|uniref:Uncharacterized protein n=1 Tax=Menopon gallinae TaxID=328185 RepID=A0AAW2HAM5_9NEOP